MSANGESRKKKGGCARFFAMCILLLVALGIVIAVVGGIGPYVAGIGFIILVVWAVMTLMRK